jgi:hypothetical protein
MAAPTLDQVRRAPKVLRHNHLDGGLRPATVVELAAEAGHSLPTTDADELAGWFNRRAHRHDLDLYLETFEHTVAVMQSKEALVRVAAECAEDLAANLGIAQVGRPTCQTRRRFWLIHGGRGAHPHRVPTARQYRRILDPRHPALRSGPQVRLTRGPMSDR